MNPSSLTTAYPERDRGIPPAIAPSTQKLISEYGAMLEGGADGVSAASLVGKDTALIPAPAAKAIETDVARSLKTFGDMGGGMVPAKKLATELGAGYSMLQGAKGEFTPWVNSMAQAFLDLPPDVAQDVMRNLRDTFSMPPSPADVKKAAAPILAKRRHLAATARAHLEEHDRRKGEAQVKAAIAGTREQDFIDKVLPTINAMPMQKRYELIEKINDAAREQNAVMSDGRAFWLGTVLAALPWALAKACYKVGVNP